MGSVEQQKHSSSTSTQRRTVDNMRIILFFSLLVGSVWSLPGITKRSTRVGPKQDKQTGIPIYPPDGQRCSGRDYQGRRCCTPENPCDEGEGDCDGPGDGGLHDGHAGCKGDLVCGSNNCKKFGHYYYEKDDCCERPETSNLTIPLTPPLDQHGANGIPIEPPVGQRCSGRNYGDKRCCTPENPCGEGEGDCDGPGDGGFHDGHAGCKGDLVCGSNNCNKFGHYYHEKDDCCEKPTQVPPESGWTAWSEFGSCRVKAGSCKKTRTRYCRGPNCPRAQHSQDRPCSCGGSI